jgi:sugar phosphate isomerase/epimerase
VEIGCSYLTLSGSVHGKPPEQGMISRAHTAFQAGFASVGASDLDAMPRKHHLPTLYTPVTELEWFDLSRPEWEVADKLMAIADRLGTVRRLNVGSCHYLSNGGEINALQCIAQRAAYHGVKVVVEPVAFGAFPTLESVMGLIAKAGGENMSLLYDTWQVYRTERKLPFVDASAIGAIQVAGSYATQTDDARYDAMRRCLPHLGVDVMDITSFLSGTFADGYDGPVCVEIPSEIEWSGQVPPLMWARASYDSLTEIICNASGS